MARNFRDYVDMEKAIEIARESAEIRAIAAREIPTIGQRGHDISALGNAIIRGMENDVKRIELQHEASAKFAADVKKDAESVGGKYKLLAVYGTRGKGRSKVPYTFFVSGFSFADGPGMRYKTVSFTTDRAKAQRFSTGMAVQLLDQLARNYTKVEAVASND